MSKISPRQPQLTYTIIQVESFDGTVTYELKRNNEVLKIYPAEALQHAIDALTRIEQNQGIRKESELYKYVVNPSETKSEAEES